MDRSVDSSAAQRNSKSQSRLSAPAPGRYRHYKGPEYRVFGCVQHSETEETLVLYRALYGERGLWVRPLGMFMEQVEVDGQEQPRFALVEAQDATDNDLGTLENLA